MALKGGQVILTDLDPGIYLVTPDGTFELIHAYDEGDYHLADIFDYFELGEVLEEDGAPGIELDAREIKQLRLMAKEYAADHPPEFIAMCRDMVKAAVDFAPEEEVVCFYENFA